MFAQEVYRIARTSRTTFEWALEDVRQEKSCTLKLGMNRLCGLSREKNTYSAKQALPLSAEVATRRVQKLRVLSRSHPSQQQRLDVHGPVTRRPFQSAQPSGEMLGRACLPTPVTTQNGRRCHQEKSLKESPRNSNSEKWRAAARRSRGLINSPNLYRVKIARSANRIAGSLWLNANIVTAVSRFTKLIATPAPDVAIHRQRAAIPGTDSNLSGVFHVFCFDNALDEFRRAIAQLPDGIESAPAIHLAFFNRAGMVQVCSDETHPGFEPLYRPGRQI